MTLKKISHHFKLALRTIEKKNSKTKWNTERGLADFCVVVKETNISDEFINVLITDIETGKKLLEKE